VDSGALAASQRAGGTLLRDVAGPAGEGAAAGRSLDARASQCFLEQEFLPEWEGRFTVAPANPSATHRPLGRGHNPAAILSQVHSRVVTNDYTLQFEKQRYQVARADIGGGRRGAKVRVEKRLDGTLAVRFRDRYLTVSVCDPAGRARPKREAARASVKKTSRVSSPPPSRRWMEGFSLKNSPPLWKVLQQEAQRCGSNSGGR